MIPDRVQDVRDRHCQKAIEFEEKSTPAAVLAAQKMRV